MHNGNDTASMEAVIRQELRRQQGRGQTYDVRVIGVEDVGQERIAAYLLGDDEDWNQQAGYAAFQRDKNGNYRLWMQRLMFPSSYGRKIWDDYVVLYGEGQFSFPESPTGRGELLICNNPRADRVEWCVSGGLVHTLDIPQMPCMLLDLSELPSDGGQWCVTVYDADGNELL